MRDNIAYDIFAGKTFRTGGFVNGSFAVSYDAASGGNGQAQSYSFFQAKERSEENIDAGQTVEHQ